MWHPSYLKRDNGIPAISFITLKRRFAFVILLCIITRSHVRARCKLSNDFEDYLDCKSNESSRPSALPTAAPTIAPSPEPSQPPSVAPSPESSQPPTVPIQAPKLGGSTFQCEKSLGEGTKTLSSIINFTYEIESSADVGVVLPLLDSAIAKSIAPDLLSCDDGPNLRLRRRSLYESSRVIAMDAAPDDEIREYCEPTNPGDFCFVMDGYLTLTFDNSKRNDTETDQAILTQSLVAIQKSLSEKPIQITFENKTILEGIQLRYLAPNSDATFSTPNVTNNWLTTIVIAAAVSAFTVIILIFATFVQLRRRRSKALRTDGEESVESSNYSSSIKECSFDDCDGESETSHQMPTELPLAGSRILLPDVSTKLSSASTKKGKKKKRWLPLTLDYKERKRRKEEFSRPIEESRSYDISCEDYYVGAGHRYTVEHPFGKPEEEDIYPSWFHSNVSDIGSNSDVASALDPFEFPSLRRSENNSIHFSFV